MEWPETTQRPVEQDHKVTPHHPWQPLPAPHPHPMRLGREPHPRLFLQPLLLSSDTSPQKEQDESTGRHCAQDACLRMAHTQPERPIQGLRQQNRDFRRKRMTRYTGHGKAIIFVMARDLALQINPRHGRRWNPV